MKKESFLNYVGEDVVLEVVNQRGCVVVLNGRVGNVYKRQLFLSGSFPNRKSSAGGIWLNINDIVSLKEQQEKK